MRINAKLLAASLLGATLTSFVGLDEARAQIPPTVERDQNWDTVSTVTMLISVTSVSLMPRVYYSSPDATVGWKGRWHVSALAPIMTMTGLTLLVDMPVKDAIQSPKVGCTAEQTIDDLPNSGCESFGGPSTHAYAAWGATGAGLSTFLVDTIDYSDYKLNVPSLIGNVIIPLSSSIVSSVARSTDGSGTGPESTGQVVAGALSGVATGAIVGLVYSKLQEPDCGYGGYLFCW